MNRLQKKVILYTLFLCIPFQIIASQNHTFSANTVNSIKCITSNTKLSFCEVLNVADTAFQKVNHKVFVESQTYWLQIKIDNSQLFSENNYIHFYEFFSGLTLFQLKSTGDIITSKGGCAIPAINRTAPLGLINDKLLFHKSDSAFTSLYIRVYCNYTCNATQLKCEVYPKDYVLKINQFNYILQSIFAGIIFIIVLLNIILYSFSKEKLYFLYSVYTAVAALFFITHTQVIEALFFKNYPIIDQYLFFSLYIGMVLYVEFLYEALKSERLPDSKKLIKFYRYITLSTTCIVCLLSINNIPLAISIGDIFSFINSILVVTIFVKYFKYVSKTIKVILIGALFIILGGGASLIADLIVYHPLHVYFYQAGFVIEIIFFTVAINFMHHNTRLEKIKIQLQNLQLEAKQLKTLKTANELKEEVDKKNRELTSKVMVISQKEELIRKIITELSLIQPNSSENLQLDSIIKKIESSLHTNNWQEFIYYFKNVHPNFYKSLNKTYPNLTANERKICAFLKLNLSSKEIAEISQKSVNTIDVARTRLRKKMRLTTSDNISTIIANIE